MDISLYLRVFRRRFWVIALSILVTLVASLISWNYLPTTYQSSAVIRVIPYSTSNPSYTQIVYADRIMNTYVEMGSGSAVMANLRQQMGLTEQQPLAVSIKIIPDTELLRITVEDYDRALATKIANAFADYLVNDKSIRDVRVVILEPATIPETPGILRIAIYCISGFLIGLILGIGIAILTENLDNRLYEESDIEKITNFPVFSRIPHSQTKLFGQYKALLNQHLSREEAPATKTSSDILQDQASDDQSYRWLAIHLIQESENKPLQSVMVSSPEPQVGKSNIAVNLAYNLAKIGKKVLLVDMDLVHPDLHTFFNIPMEVGLWNYLLSKASLRRVTWKTDKPGLYVIPAGDYLDGSGEPIVNLLKIRKLCKSASAHYDFIIFDSPAFLGMSDCLMLSKEVDAVLIVIQLGKSRKHLLEAICKQMNHRADKVTGIVVNNSKNWHTPWSMQYFKNKNKLFDKKYGPEHVTLPPESINNTNQSITNNQEVII